MEAASYARALRDRADRVSMPPYAPAATGRKVCRAAHTDPRPGDEAVSRIFASQAAAWIAEPSMAARPSKSRRREVTVTSR